MELRGFKPSDLDALVEIDGACFPPGISYSREVLDDCTADPHSATWIAQERDEIVGFLIAHHETKSRAHIITLDVVESWRRRGVGGALMDEAEAWAKRRGAGLVYLETAEDNLPAQKFYVARGYAKVQTVEGYYSNGAAAWVMVKQIRQDR